MFVAARRTVFLGAAAFALSGLTGACAPGGGVSALRNASHGASSRGGARQAPLPANYVQQFDDLWARFDALYPSFAYKDIDWDAQREAYRGRAQRARSQAELISIAAEMLEPLRDLHIWFVDPRGQVLPTYRPSRVTNFDQSRWQRALRHTDYVQRAPDLGEASMAGFSYLFLGSWRDAVDIAALDLTMSRLRESPGMIIDLRTNSGGSDETALAFASRFTGRSFTASYVQVRNGPSHTDLDSRTARTIAPRGPWQYLRPVVVITGRGGFSATESFVAAMRTLPNVTVIGDTTGGASGSPASFPLGGGWSYTVPQWIEYGPDHEPIEWRGVAPHVVMAWAPSTYDRNRDPLIDAAVGVLAERNGVFQVAPSAGPEANPPGTTPSGSGPSDRPPPRPGIDTDAARTPGTPR